MQAMDVEVDPAMLLMLISNTPLISSSKMNCLCILISLVACTFTCVLAFVPDVQCINRRILVSVSKLNAFRSSSSVVAVADISSLPNPTKEDLDDTLQQDLVATTEAALDDVMGDEQYLIQSRRAFIGGVASTATLGSIAMCTCGCQGRQKLFANMLNNGMHDYEALPQVQKFKSRLFDHISAGDDIMEIGIGSAPNLKYYADKSIGKLMALEPNREFDEYIAQNVAKSNLQTRVSIVPGVAESIPKADNSVDVVVGTMVMCSVSSVKQSLAEVYRILKPGGRYIYTEHIAAPETAKALTFAQQLADPLQQALAEGCHLRRDPEHE